MKTSPQVTTDRAAWHLKTRFNPLRGLTPEKLSAQLDAWDKGDIKGFALTAEQIRNRDSVVGSVTAKRYGAVGKRQWSIVELEDSDRAKRHAEELRYFYNNVAATSVLKRNVRGRASMLFRQLAQAAGLGWSAHEIVWQPSRAGLSATLHHVPLYFFESRQGDLRYLPADTAYDGVPLEEAGWLVAAHEQGALMLATAVDWMFKNLPRKDWLGFCEKFGIPGIFAKTSAQPGSAEWEALHQGIRDFMSDWSGLGNAEIQFLTPGSGSMNPMKDLIEYCDRQIMTLWRGGDLSSRGGDNATGATLQQTEMEILEGDDIELVQAACNTGLDPWVIRYTIGDDAPLARLEIQTPEHFDSKEERATDQFFIEHGVPLSTKDLYKRHGRPIPEPGEEVTSTQTAAGGEGSISGVETAGADPAQPKEKAAEDPTDPEDQPDPTDLANEEPSTQNQEPATEALIFAAVERSLDLVPGLLADTAGPLYRALIESAESGWLADDQLIEAARETLLRLPDLPPSTTGADTLVSLAKIIEQTLGAATANGIEKAVLKPAS